MTLHYRGINKRGNVLDLGTPFVVLFMVAGVLFMYLISANSLNASLVSPTLVLAIADNAIAFEREEKALLLSLYCADSDVETLESRYCGEFSSLSHVSFLTQNSDPIKSGLNAGNFCESIYSFEERGSEVRVERSGLVKEEPLFAENEDLNFNMRLEYYLNKEYVFTQDDC